MKKILLTILIYLNLIQYAQSLEIVYPKTNPAKINANSTFFIGSTNQNEILKINGENIQLGPNGSFAQVVPLTTGQNVFHIESGEDKLDFTIEKPEQQTCTKQAQTLNEFPTLTFQTINEEAPLRMTPIDSGINRMAHLPLNSKLQINGEKGNFYRVYLNSQQTGWINKNDVKQICPLIEKIALKNFKSKETNKYYKYEWELTDKPPFSIKEENGLTLQLFNIDGQKDNTITFNVPVKNLFGYETYFEENKFILKIRKNAIPNIKYPIKDIKIMVDPGHGGCEKGAIGCTGTYEKDINLAIAKNLRDELQSRFADIKMSREEDVQISLKDRVKKSKENDTEIFVSVHANALPDGQNPLQNKGTSIYYFYPQAKPLAECIMNSMTSQLGTNNDKVRQGSLAVARQTSAVSVLIEVAYIINPEDCALLNDCEFQKKCAKAIADGIEQYILNYSN